MGEGLAKLLLFDKLPSGEESEKVWKPSVQVPFLVLLFPILRLMFQVDISRDRTGLDSAHSVVL